MPNYRRYFLPNSISFLTLVTFEREPFFGKAEMVQMAMEKIRTAKSIHPFKMRGYVVMPDHLHLLIWTSDGRFDKVVHSIKRNMAFELHREKELGGALWQGRFYDHVIRDDADFKRHLDYIHYNPVHHGVAIKPFDYPFSSFRHYVEKGWYETDWGAMPVESIEEMDLE